MDKILIASNLVPKNIRGQMINASLSIAKGVIIVDGCEVNIEGPGITDEMREKYERSVAGVAERVFYADSVVGEHVTRKRIKEHKRLVDRYRIDQEAEVFAQLKGVPRVKVPKTATEFERERQKRRKEAEKERKRTAEASKPWYLRNYDES